MYPGLRNVNFSETFAYVVNERSHTKKKCSRLYFSFCEYQPSVGFEFPKFTAEDKQNNQIFESPKKEMVWIGSE